jgi:hypothetical protein
VPFALHANIADDAHAIDGLAANDIATIAQLGQPGALAVDFRNLTHVPPGIADGDDGFNFTTSAPLVLNGGVLSLGTVTHDNLGAGSVDGSNIVDGSVDARHLAVGAVGAAQLADHAVTSSHIVDGAIGSAQLANGTVHAAHLAANRTELFTVTAVGCASTSLGTVTLASTCEVTTCSSSQSVRGCDGVCRSIQVIGPGGGIVITHPSTTCSNAPIGFLVPLD